MSKIQIWQGGAFETAISMEAPYLPPKVLCLKQNNVATTEFLSAIRQLCTRVITNNEKFVIRDGSKHPRIQGYTDYSKFEYISTAAAVVLTAEYERVAKLNNETPPTAELHKWSEEVFRKLYQLGFFEVVGHVPKRKDVIIDFGATRTMQIISTENNDDLDRIDRSLQELGEFLNPDKNIPEEILVEILTAISEAISNVKHHAYPADYPLAYPHLNRLWVAATANRDKNTLTIVVYDQGATIPVTYPRMSRRDRVRTFLQRAIRPETDFEYQNDGTYIRAAMRYGGSRTEKEYRGRGLPQMIEVLTRIGLGQMSVYSRGGWCSQSSNGRLTSGANGFSIGGTLIEWTLELPLIRSVVTV
ncbi:ATP-binding protein [Brucella pseudintermedia]|uniref:ATP-binding protein n=1 Tax=Brucella pseudintermedia TaxID=370111 RepID=UPI00124DEB83|nr:hypothetical protein [Brucella pseudintermedia]KAB2682941.1 ATP-binding protein [Brucella pseudintermedia]